MDAYAGLSLNNTSRDYDGDVTKSAFANPRTNRDIISVERRENTLKFNINPTQRGELLKREPEIPSPRKANVD